MQALLYLVNCGKLSPSNFVEICVFQLRRQEFIGSIALRRRLLTIAQVFNIVDSQAMDDRLFGALAIAGGFLSHEQVTSLILEQQHKRHSLQSIALEMQLVTEEEWAIARREVSLGGFPMNWRAQNLPTATASIFPAEQLGQVTELESSI
jgi:hypothetical protein